MSRYGMHVERRPSRLAVEPRDEALAELASAAKSIGVALAYVRHANER
jgi:hypothetical protein